MCAFTLVAGTLTIAGVVVPASPASAAAVPCTPDVGYTACVAYTYSGADEVFTVPAGITSVAVKVWGAGAGGSIATALSIGAPGGSGGFVGGTLTVTPGSQYAVVVGEGGGADGSSVASTICQRAYGFGGACAPVRGGSHVDGGGGGGLSGLFTGTATVTAADQARAILIAGGGGAGEGTNACGNASAAGGAGGNGFAGGMPTMQGIDGAYTVAQGGSIYTGGGGGYNGGDGIGARLANGCARGADGGTNFVAGSVGSPVNLAGTEAPSVPNYTTKVPPRSTDVNYAAGVGVGQTALATAGGNGRVVVQWVEVDFGDAPTGYGTLLVDGGPRHAVTGPMLGAARDSEVDGQPNATATGDDTTGTDDEDGVVFNTDVSVPGRLETVFVTASAPGYLNGWIDFNRNGMFDPSERIFSDKPLVAGVNTIQYTVPTGAAFVPGDTFARFRVTGAANQATSPTGVAPNGEVEDYQRTLFDAQAVALAACPAGSIPTPVSVVQNPSFETRTGNFANSGAANTINYAQHWYDSHPTGGQYHVFNPPTFDSGPAAATQPTRAGADGFGFLGGHSSGLPPNGVGEGATNTLASPLIPGATYVGFFSMTAGGYSREGNARTTFWGTNNSNVGHIAGSGVVAPTSSNIEQLYTSPTVDYPGSGVRPQWELTTFSMTPTQAWTRLRVEVRNANPANNGTVAGQTWTNFDDFRMYLCDPILDSGDAPASYGTTVAGNGARHMLPNFDDATDTTPLMLGSTVDVDNDGTPTAAADGDDVADIDDEDGVAVPITVQPGQAATVVVSATNDTAQPATLAGWIDLNNNGTFDPGERATAAVPASSGTQDYTLTFPVGSPTANTFARFRLFPGTVAAPLPTGIASAGEVEDYPVVLSLYEIEKTADPPEGTVVQPGSTVTYTVTITNLSPGPITGVTFTDDLSGVDDDATINPTATVTPAAAGTALIAGNVLTFNGGAVASGTTTITYTATVDNASTGDQTLGNVVVAPGSANCAPPVLPSDPADAGCITSHPLADPQLTVVKSASPNVAAAYTLGQLITYSFVLTNTGNVTLTNVAPVEVSFTGVGSLSPISCPPAAASLPPAAQVTCTATYTLQQGDIDASSLTNVAGGTGTPPVGPPPVVPPDTVVTPGTPQPSITVAKTASPATAGAVGDVITYTFRVTNTGNVTMNGIDIVEGVFTGTGAAPVAICPPAALLPGQFLDCTATYTLTQTDVNNGLVTNTATATGIPPTGPPVTSPPDTATVTVPPAPGLTVAKTANPTTGGTAGQVITYSFLVRNTGNVTLANVNVVDSGFSGTGTLSPVSCPPAASSLAPGAEVTCTASYTLTQADVNTGQVTNRATADGTPPTGPPVTSPPGDTTVNIPPDPKLAIDKTATPTTGGAVDDLITYSFVVTNTGNVTLTNVDVVEGSFSGTGTLSPVSCPPAASSLAPGAEVTCTATYTLTQTDVNIGQVTNSATAGGTPPTGPPVTSPPGGTTVNIPPAPGVTVVKSASPNLAAAFNVGQVITYSFVATNTGNVTLTGVTVSDTGFSGVGPLSPIACPGGNGSVTLAAGQQVTCTATYTLQQGDIDAGSITNSAGATGTPPAGPPTPAPPTTVTIPGDPQPGLTVVKTADPATAGAVGDVITYSFLVTNSGNVTMTGIDINEGLFTGSGPAPVATCPAAAAASLLPGQQVTCTATYTLTQTDVNTGVVTNSATATGTPPSGTPVTSPPDLEIVTIPPAPGLTVVKSASPNLAAAFNVGQVITYSFVATNTGNVTLDNVSVTDGGGFTGVGALSAVACPGGNGSVTLQPSQQVTCTATYTLQQGDIDTGSVTNSATATGTPPTGPPVPAPPTTVTIPGDPQPALTLEKSANPATGGAAGDVITYSFLITNTGNVTITNVQPVEETFSGTGTIALISCPPAAAALIPGQQVTCTADYTLTQADVDAGQVTNSATATGTPPSGSAVTSPPDDTTVTIPPAPALTVDKSAFPTSAGAEGDEITYSFLITNTGNVTLTYVHPVEGAFSGTGTPSPIACPGAPVTLAPGQNVTCTSTYTLTQADVDAGEVTNTATATGNPPNPFTPPPTSPPDGVTVTIPPAPRLTIVKTADPTPTGEVGDVITYSFLLANTGNVTLTDVHPVEGAFSGTGDLSDITCPGAPVMLAPGDDVTCTATYSLTQADVDSGELTNDATATGIPPNPSTPAPTQPPSEVTVDIPADSELTIVKTADPATAAAAGDVITYSFVVTNTGNVTVDEIEIDDSDFSGSGPRGPIVCPGVANGLIALGSGASITCTMTYTLTLQDVNDGEVINTATASGLTPGNLPVTSEPDDAEVLIDPAPALTVVKSASPNNSAGFTVGQVITYTFVVTNTGNVTLTDIEVDETSFTGAGAMSPIVCGPGAASLDPGAQVTCTATYTLVQADIDAGAVRNAATATGTPPPGPGTPPPTSPPGEVTIPGDLVPAISVVKTADPATISVVGQVVTYSFLITNTGNTTLKNATVQEGTFTGTGALSPVTCPPAAATLLPGAQVTCTATYTVTQADVDSDGVTNTATATATAPPGVDPPVSPPTTVTVPSEAEGLLTLTKTATPVDVNGNGITDIGDRIDWTLVVANIGTVTVAGVVVTDPTAGAVTCPSTVLAPGTAMTCTTAGHTITAADAATGQVRNVATASGDGGTGEPVVTPPAEAQVVVQAVVIPPATIPTTTPDPGQLPATGGNTNDMLRTVWILGLAGLLLALVARRRRITG